MTRSRVEPMVRGLFPKKEQDRVLSQDLTAHVWLVEPPCFRARTLRVEQAGNGRVEEDGPHHFCVPARAAVRRVARCLARKASRSSGSAPSGQRLASSSKSSTGCTPCARASSSMDCGTSRPAGGGGVEPDRARDVTSSSIAPRFGRWGGGASAVTNLCQISCPFLAYADLS